MHLLLPAPVVENATILKDLQNQLTHYVNYPSKTRLNKKGMYFYRNNHIIAISIIDSQRNDEYTMINCPSLASRGQFLLLVASLWVVGYSILGLDIIVLLYYTEAKTLNTM